MNNTIKVKSGESTNIQQITHKINGEAVTDYSKYTLNIDVIKSGTKESTGLVRSIAGTASGFEFGLLPGDTRQLGPGNYVIVADFTKVDDSGVEVFNKELTWKLEIVPGLRD